MIVFEPLVAAALNARPFVALPVEHAHVGRDWFARSSDRFFKSLESVNISLHIAERLFLAQDDVFHCENEFFVGDFVGRFHDDEAMPEQPQHVVIGRGIAQLALVLPGGSNGF